jgi:hypothetical protein
MSGFISRDLGGTAAPITGIPPELVAGASAARIQNEAQTGETTTTATTTTSAFGVLGNLFNWRGGTNQSPPDLQTAAAEVRNAVPASAPAPAPAPPSKSDPEIKEHASADRNYEMYLSVFDRRQLVLFLNMFAGQLSYGGAIESVFNSTIGDGNIMRMLEAVPMTQPKPALEYARLDGSQQTIGPWEYIMFRCKPAVVSAVAETFHTYRKLCYPKPTIDQLIRNQKCVVPFALVCADAARTVYAALHNGTDSRRVLATIYQSNLHMKNMVAVLRDEKYIPPTGVNRLRLP